MTSIIILVVVYILGISTGLSVAYKVNPVMENSPIVQEVVAVIERIVPVILEKEISKLQQPKDPQVDKK